MKLKKMKLKKNQHKTSFLSKINMIKLKKSQNFKKISKPY